MRGLNAKICDASMNHNKFCHMIININKLGFGKMDNAECAMPNASFYIIRPISPDS